MTNWIRILNYTDWTCINCKRDFIQPIPCRIRLSSLNYLYVWCEDCYQKLQYKMKKLKKCNN